MCRENQKGQVQWAKDGFALGFNRRVPGYPRYSYLGNPAEGEHHLIIKGVTLEDDGEYQCQVGPTANTKAIWASANVTVMVSPASISVIGRDDNSVVEVVSGKVLRLECLVADARPAAAVAWYKGGLRMDSVALTPRYTSLPGSHQEFVERSQKPRMLNVRSRLTLRPEASSDGEEYSCQAIHPALEGSPTSLVASVTLSVLHPSSAPKITGYKTGEILLDGEHRTLTCRVSGGNPRPRVTWYRHGRALILTAVAAPSATLPAITTATPKEEGVVFVTQQIVAMRQEDTAVYECRVYNKLLNYPLTTNVTLTVHYPPAKVFIKGPNTASADKTFTLTCQTSPANPAANITWFIQGDRMVRARLKTTEDEGGGWVTYSELSHTLQSTEDAHINVECQAANSASEAPATETKVINVIKRPGWPELTIQGNGPVTAGTKLGVKCTSEGGNPPPTVRLYLGDEELETTVKHEETDTTAEATLEVTAGNNGEKVTCELISPATSSPIRVNKVVNVFFPPWEVTVWTRPKTVEAGSEIFIICESSSSLPASVISWYSGGLKLEGARVTQTPGLFSGTVTRSELEVLTVAEDNGRVFTCTADNNLSIGVSENATLSVLHGALWITPPPEVVEVHEGDDLLLTANAVANPPPVRYSWWRGPAAVQSEEAEGDELGILRLTRVDRQYSGNYSVVATSPRGDTNATFAINVLYGPEEVVAAERVTVDEEGTKTILCSALGNPTPTITWTRGPDNSIYSSYDTNSSSGVYLATGVGEARLVMEWASRADTGKYHCHATNTVSTSPPITTVVVVTQPPEPSINTQAMTNPWALMGGIGRLDCRVRAAPAPTFTWSINDESQVLYNGNKYSISVPELIDDVIEWSSELEIKDVNVRDYGLYICTAHNSQGSCTTNFTLTPPPPPRAPLNFTAVIVRSNSVVFSWQQDTLGAPPRGHQIRFQASGAKNFQYVDVPGSNTTNVTITGLTPGTDYGFTIQAYSDQGESHYVTPMVIVNTMVDVVGEVASSAVDGSLSRMPRLALLLISLTGTALLVLNVSIIVCFLRRRSARRNLRVSTSKTTTLEVSTPSLGEQLDLTPASDAPPPDYQAMCHSSSLECEETSFTNDQYSAGTSRSTPPLPRTSPKSTKNSPLLNGGVRLESQTTIVPDDEILPPDPMAAMASSTPKKQQQQFDAVYKSHPNIPDVCPVGSSSVYDNLDDEDDDVEQQEDDFPGYLDDDDPSQPLFHRTELCTILEDDAIDSPEQQVMRGDLQRQASFRSSPTPYHSIPTHPERYSPVPAAAQPQPCCQQPAAAPPLLLLLPRRLQRPPRLLPPLSTSPAAGPLR
ncbi:nephrin-like isoform X2 [Macrobrachium rosenbergii]|uniref:nephrin-like isoform X2 n=1 Tax=Macrobrachium rosenbergii TaxID=79674 RepID=UPI0034D73ECA